jgi:pilus assembly protein CpaF
MSDQLTNLERFGGKYQEEDPFWRRMRSGREIHIEREETESQDLKRFKRRVHRRLLNDFESGELTGLSKAKLKELVEHVMNTEIESEERAISSPIRSRLVTQVMDELIGFGPLQPFLEDPNVTEIMVNGHDQIYIEREGKLFYTDRGFDDNAHVMQVVERIVAGIGRRVDEASPMVDARLPDGSRVNVIIPPISIKGPMVTVRKFPQQAFDSDTLVRIGTMTEEMKLYLQACVQARLNILITGGTGSGKTTTLNALSNFIQDDQRIITIEDAAELQLQQRHVVTLEGRPPNLENKGEITIRMLVRNALRMRPDRIIVGEVRGDETLDMLQAMNTGHDGSMSTLHSNSPRDATVRLETLALMAGLDLPSRAIREQIASAINIIVHQSRLQDGKRRITHVSEIQGMEGNVLVIQDIFKWEQTGIDQEGNVMGAQYPTGLRPKFLDRILERGLQLPATLFVRKHN